jgi:hypothetical protein
MQILSKQCLTSFPKIRSMQSPGCLCVFSCHYWLFSASTDLYETWYMHHDNRCNLNGVYNKSFILVRVSLCVILPIVAKQRFGTNLFGARLRKDEDVSAASNRGKNRINVRWFTFCVCKTSNCVSETGFVSWFVSNEKLTKYTIFAINLRSLKAYD